jgi:hypothetical protein
MSIKLVRRVQANVQNHHEMRRLRLHADFAY